MINKIILIVCLFFISLPLSLSADSAEKRWLTLTLDEAWEIMEGNNSELRTLYLELGDAIRKADAREQLIPSVSTGASLKRTSPFISRYTMPSDSVRDESDYWTARGSLDFQLKITPGYSVEEQLQQLKVDLLDLQITGMLKALKYDLSVLYYNILSGEKRIALQQESLQLAKNRLSQTELQYEQGLKSELELLSAKIGAARDVPALQKEKTAQEKRFITLRNSLNLDEIMIIELLPEVLDESLFPEKKMVLSSVPASLDIITLEKQIQQAELIFKKAKKDIKGLSLEMSLGVSSNVNNALEGNSWSDEKWRDDLGVGVALTIPLDGFIKGSSDQLTLKSLEEEIDIARINLDEAGRSLKDEIRALYLDIDLSRSNIEVDELNVSLWEQNYIKMEQNYNSGRVSLMDLDDSRQELKEALLTLEDEKLNLTTLRVELLNLLSLN